MTQALDTVFVWLFAAFAFSAISGIPAGFTSSFSILAFFSALPIVLIKQGNQRHPLFLLLGLVLFCWLLASVFWSEGQVRSAISSVLEYRIFFMVPIFTIALLGIKGSDEYVLKGLLAGGCFALIISYAVTWGGVSLEGVARSLGGRIFHGFSMATLLALVMSAVVGGREIETNGHVARYFLAVAIVVNVYFIETGRTAYLLCGAVIALYILFFLHGQARYVGIVSCIIATSCVLLFGVDVVENISMSYSNLTQYFENDLWFTSIGLRLEYFNVTNLITTPQQLVFGFGVGGVDGVLTDAFSQNIIRFQTDNVHNEYLQLLLAGGLIALILYTILMADFFVKARQLYHVNRQLSFLFASIGLVVIISSLTSTTLKDFGHKHLLIAIFTYLALRFMRLDLSQGRV